MTHGRKTIMNAHQYIDKQIQIRSLLIFLSFFVYIILLITTDIIIAGCVLSFLYASTFIYSFNKITCPLCNCHLYWDLCKFVFGLPLTYKTCPYCSNDLKIKLNVC